MSKDARDSTFTCRGHCTNGACEATADKASKRLSGTGPGDPTTGNARGGSLVVLPARFAPAPDTIYECFLSKLIVGRPSNITAIILVSSGVAPAKHPAWLSRWGSGR